MEKSYLMLSLDDDKAKDLADVMGNKTCKKILSILANAERSESDIAKDLSQPMNTVEYNLKKLVSAGLVEKSKDYFWSIKGKRIPVYKLSNKYIVIAPRSSSLAGLKTFLPVAVILGIGAVAVNYFSNTFYPAEKPVLMSKVADSALTEIAQINEVHQTFFQWLISTPWAVFISGGVLVILAYFIIKKFLRAEK
jgi:DNA-binding transcriptional ArsR family regulator